MANENISKLIKNESLKNEFEEEQKFQEDTILELLGPIAPSPLKSAETQDKEKKQQTKEIMDLMSQDLTMAVSLFNNKSLPQEKKDFKKILNKLVSLAEKNEAKPISTEDCEFLEEIAKRKLLKQEFLDAGRMFRFIIQLDIGYSGAWVGWALSEQEQQHWDIADQIYNLAINMLPGDIYIALFAADFYIYVNQQQRAIEILEQSKDRLIENNLQTSKSYELVTQALERLQNTMR